MWLYSVSMNFIKVLNEENFFIFSIILYKSYCLPQDFQNVINSKKDLRNALLLPVYLGNLLIIESSIDGIHFVREYVGKANKNFDKSDSATKRKKSIDLD